MSNLTDLIDRYIAIWNETDRTRRQDLIARTWTENASYLDPHMEGKGQDGIDAMIEGGIPIMLDVRRHIDALRGGL